MTDFDFDIPIRFDENTADAGTDFAIYDENKAHWGTFTCRMFDTDSRHIKLVQERLKTKHAKEIRLGTVDNEQLALEVFLEAILVGWKDVKFRGKEVKFSKEAARAYFAIPRTKYALQELLLQVQDVRNFQAPNKDEVAGN